MDSAHDTRCRVGCPIRKSSDQSLLAAPRGLSQRATSFIASWRQGIHQMPLLSSTHPSDNRTPAATRPNLPLPSGWTVPATTRSTKTLPPAPGKRAAYPCQFDAPARRRNKKGRTHHLPAPVHATMHEGRDIPRARERAFITTIRCKRTVPYRRPPAASHEDAAAGLQGRGFPSGTAAGRDPSHTNARGRSRGLGGPGPT